MDADRFDILSRSLSGFSTRRGALATSLSGLLSLLGLPTTEAKKGKGKKKRKKKRKKTLTPQCTPNCSGRVCGGDGCGGSCGGDCTGGNVCQDGSCVCPGGWQSCQGSCCAPGRGCLSGTCVTLQGTCAAGADICANGTAFCGGGTSCHCRFTAEGKTRCGGAQLSNPNTCTLDSQCAELFPETPGVFCHFGPGCFSQGVCFAPCPV